MAVSTVLTVVSDSNGEISAAVVFHGDRPPDPGKDPEGMRLLPGPGEAVEMVDPPGELVGKEQNDEYFEILRSYVVRKGVLVKKEQ